MTAFLVRRDEASRNANLLGQTRRWPLTITAIGFVLLAAAPVQAAEEAPPVQDIVVLNKMLDAVVFKWRGEKVDGKFRMVGCEIVRGSGDAKVDAITCKATEACLPVLETLRKQRRKAPFDECLTSTRKQMISDLFDARAQELAEESP